MKHRFSAVVIGCASLLLLATAAYADVIHNTLDNSVDSEHESMTVFYDSGAATGTPATTSLAILVEGSPDHPGCNIQGGAHWISVTPSSSDANVATVAVSNDGRFNACTDTLTATVTPLGLGSATMTFAIDGGRTANDPHLDFSTVEATFDVNVIEGAGSPPIVCDANPAAPAWAAAILQGNQTKPKLKGQEAANYISTIAREMEQGATFGGLAKTEPDYPERVHERLRELTGLSLPNGPADVARPGWTCATQSTS